MNIHYLNWNKEDFLKLGHIYRYMELEKFKKLINENAIVMGSPQEWSDPFESKMLTRKYTLDNDNDIDYKFKDELKACCFTNPINCEAQWGAYQHKSTMVQISFNINKLLVGITKLNGNSDLYIGLVRYFKTSGIDKEAKIILDNKFIPNQDEDWLRLMLLKRIAYSYEKEIRFLTISKSQTEVRLEFDDIKSLIDRVTIEPNKSNKIDEKQRQAKEYIENLGLDASVSHLYHKANKYSTLNINIK